MCKDRYYRCLRCGHQGTGVTYNAGLPVAAVCAICGSYEIEPCPAPEGRVPMRVLQSAETQALHWKKQAEQLSALINRAALAGVIPAGYVTEAKQIQAGTI